MVKLHKAAASDAGAALPTGITTTYRVVSDGTETRPPLRTAAPAAPVPPPTAGLRQWLRRQHPADVVRILLMLVALGAVILAMLRLG